MHAQQQHFLTKRKTKDQLEGRVLQKRNRTGLPDQLKTGVENLSGYSMDDVKVHYNSSKPATLQAHAYAQGNQIHLGPGQERHLPHEAWHVVQQKQGRVKPTIQAKEGTLINDNVGLEREADVMGIRANEFTNDSRNQTHEVDRNNSIHLRHKSQPTIQRFKLKKEYSIAKSSRVTPPGIEFKKLDTGNKRHHIIPESSIRIYLGQYSQEHEGDMSALSSWAEHTIKLEINRYKDEINRLRSTETPDDGKRMIKRHEMEIKNLSTLISNVQKNNELNNEDAERVINLLTWTPSNVIIGTGVKRSHEPGENLDFELLDHVQNQDQRDRIVLASFLLYEKLKSKPGVEKNSNKLAQTNLHRLLSFSKVGDKMQSAPENTVKIINLAKTHGFNLENLMTSIACRSEHNLAEAESLGTGSPIQNDSDWKTFAKKILLKPKTQPPPGSFIEDPE